MKKYAFLSILSLAFVFASAGESFACSCMAPSPDTPMKKLVADAKGGTDAVFVGKVVKVRVSDENSPAATNFIKLEVLRSWKGVTGEYIEIETPANSAMCGVGFEVGKEYIVYAGKGEAEAFTTHLCSRTQNISGKSGDERHLGKRLKLSRKKD